MSKEQPAGFQHEFATITARILLVDDEPDFLEQLSSRLKIRGARVDTALNCEEALKKIDNQEFDAIVVDLSMPGVDGLETTKRIKSSHPASEVIILTGHGSIQSGIKAMKMGAFDFLEKPVEINSLMEKIRNARTKHQKAAKAESMVQVKKILNSQGW